MNWLVVYAVAATVCAVAAGTLALLAVLALLRQVKRYVNLREQASSGWTSEPVSAVVTAWRELIGDLPAVPSHRAPRGGGHA